MRAAEPTVESAPWAEFVPSVLSDHGTECCALARAWYTAMDRSMWRGEGGPAWIPKKFPWGPSRWPLHWCDAMEAEELDCGAHQALSREAFRARGIHVVPVQLVLREESHHLPHLHDRWGAADASPAWAREGVAYHESCATLGTAARRCGTRRSAPGSRRSTWKGCAASPRCASAGRPGRRRRWTGAG
jgi:hypothetical protein